jgi:hypothetical protein
MKKINKRKKTKPRRYTPPNRRPPIPNYKTAWEALNVANKHFRTHTNPEQIAELNVLADDREWRYGTGPLSNPFDLSDDFLHHYKNKSAMENFTFTGGNWHQGYPFNPDPDQKWVLDYNKHLIHDFNKHLKTRQQHKDYERLDNNILYPFKW